MKKAPTKATFFECTYILAKFLYKGNTLGQEATERNHTP